MKKLAIAIACVLVSTIPAHSQTANGRVTTAAPAYTNNTASPLSLDEDGGLRVNCVTGCTTTGAQDVNISEVGGNPVTTTVPISGAVTGNVGVTSLPSIPAGSNAIGTVGVTALPSLPAGSNTIGGVDVISSPGLTDTQLRATPLEVIETTATPLQSFGVFNATITAQVITNRPGRFYNIFTSSSAATVFTLYDNASACSGTILLQATTAASYASALNFQFIPGGIEFSNGMTFCSSAAGSRSVAVTFTN